MHRQLRQVNAAAPMHGDSAFLRRVSGGLSWKLTWNQAGLLFQQRSGANARLGTELRRRHLSAVSVFDLGHFDFSAVCGDAETSITDGCDRSDVAGDLRKRSHRMLARVEELQLLTKIGRAHV